MSGSISFSENDGWYGREYKKRRCTSCQWFLCLCFYLFIPALKKTLCKAFINTKALFVGTSDIVCGRTTPGLLCVYMVSGRVRFDNAMQLNAIDLRWLCCSGESIGFATVSIDHKRNTSLWCCLSLPLSTRDWNPFVVLSWMSSRVMVKCLPLHGISITFRCVMLDQRGTETNSMSNVVVD